MSADLRHAEFYLEFVASALRVTTRKEGVVVDPGGLREIVPQLAKAQRWAASRAHELPAAASLCLQYAQLLAIPAFLDVIGPTLGLRWTSEARDAAKHLGVLSPGEDVVAHVFTVNPGETEKRSGTTETPDEILLGGTVEGDSFREQALLTIEGKAHYDAGRLKDALSHWTRALDLSRVSEESTLQDAILLGDIGMAYSDLGQTELAIDYKQQSLALARVLCSEENVAIQLQNLGGDYSRLGRSSDAQTCLDEALDLHRAAGRDLHEAQTLSTLAHVFDARDDAESAAYFTERAITIALRCGDAYRASLWTSSLAEQHLPISDPAYARRLVSTARKAAQKTGNVEANASAFSVEGQVHFLSGDYEEAERCLRSATRLFDTLDLPAQQKQAKGRLYLVRRFKAGGHRPFLRHLLPEAILSRGELKLLRQYASSFTNSEHDVWASAAARRLVVVARRARSVEDEILGHLCLVASYYRLGLSPIAEEAARSALTLAESIQDRTSAAIAMGAAAYCIADSGDYSAAAPLHAQAGQLASDAGLVEAAAGARVGYALAMDALGEHGEAADVLRELAGLKIDSIRVNATGNLGNVLAQLGRIEEAEALLVRAVDESRRLKSARLVNYMSGYLAVERLLSGRPESALEAAAVAVKSPDPSNNHFIAAIEGAALTLLGDASGARPRLERALWCAERLLLQSPRYHRAKSSKAIAVALLADDDDSRAEAQNALQEGFESCPAPGTVRRVLAILRAVADARDDAWLDEVAGASLGQTSP